MAGSLAKVGADDRRYTFVESRGRFFGCSASGYVVGNGHLLLGGPWRLIGL